MTFALLPVKDPRRAKQRLSGALGAAEREALARGMYRKVAEALAAARGIDRVAVVTNDQLTAQDARRRRFLVFEEPEQVSHSRSADLAAERAMELGATTALLLPIDVPLVTPAEIESLLEAPRPGILIVPSLDGAGTNALVRTPPDAMQSRFGPGSFLAHLEQARSRGLAVRVARPPGLVFDVDTPQDLAQLLGQCPSLSPA